MPIDAPAALTHRVGPLPVWGWGIAGIGGVGLFLFLRRSTGQQAGGSAGTGVVDLGAGGSGGAGAPASGSASVASPWSDVPASPWDPAWSTNHALIPPDWLAWIERNAPDYLTSAAPPPTGTGNGNPPPTGTGGGGSNPPPATGGWLDWWLNWFRGGRNSSGIETTNPPPTTGTGDSPAGADSIPALIISAISGGGSNVVPDSVIAATPVAGLGGTWTPPEAGSSLSGSNGSAFPSQMEALQNADPNNPADVAYLTQFYKDPLKAKQAIYNVQAWLGVGPTAPAMQPTGPMGELQQAGVLAQVRNTRAAATMIHDANGMAHWLDANGNEVGFIPTQGVNPAGTSAGPVTPSPAEGKPYVAPTSGYPVAYYVNGVLHHTDSLTGKQID